MSGIINNNSMEDQEILGNLVNRYICHKVFKCKKCGQCCKNPPIVILTKNDIFRMAKHFKKSYRNILDEYTRNAISAEGAKVLSIKYTKPCMFLDESNECKIYKVRPVICTLYPFLTSNSEYSKGNYSAVYLYDCPGMRDLVEGCNSPMDILVRCCLKENPNATSEQVADYIAKKITEALKTFKEKGIVDKDGRLNNVLKEDLIKDVYEI